MRTIVLISLIFLFSMVIGYHSYGQMEFESDTLTTLFRFDTIDEARELLTFYFGEDAGRKAKPKILT